MIRKRSGLHTVGPIYQNTTHVHQSCLQRQIARTCQQCHCYVSNLCMVTLPTCKPAHKQCTIDMVIKRAQLTTSANPAVLCKPLTQVVATACQAALPLTAVTEGHHHADASSNTVLHFVSHWHVLDLPIKHTGYKVHSLQQHNPKLCGCKPRKPHTPVSSTASNTYCHKLHSQPKPLGCFGKSAALKYLRLLNPLALNPSTAPLPCRNS
jgi:hypothetical protein